MLKPYRVLLQAFSLPEMPPRLLLEAAQGVSGLLQWRALIAACKPEELEILN